MNWIEEADWKCRHKRQILFAKDSEFLQDVALLLHHQEHRAAVLWAFDFAAESVCWLEKRYPGEERPGRALQAARDWAAGTVKMPLTQRAILDCNVLAKEISDRADQAVCHAVGQACAVVHTAGHAMGYPLYDPVSYTHLTLWKRENRNTLTDCFTGVRMWGNIKAHGRTFCSDSSCAVYLRVNCCGSRRRSISCVRWPVLPWRMLHPV